MDFTPHRKLAARATRAILERIGVEQERTLADPARVGSTAASRCLFPANDACAEIELDTFCVQSCRAKDSVQAWGRGSRPLVQ